MRIEAGRVTGSGHLVNRVYFSITNKGEDKSEDVELDLMEDEALALIMCLSEAVFHANFERVRKAKPY